MSLKTQFSCNSTWPKKHWKDLGPPQIQPCLQLEEASNFSKYPKESHQKWHAKEGFLLMATRNPAFTHQLRLVVFPCFSHYLHGFSTIPGGWPWDFWLPSTVSLSNKPKRPVRRPLHGDCFCWSKRCRL